MRPPKHGNAINDRDVAYLLRVLRRVVTDPKRLPDERREIEKHLRIVISLLIGARKDTHALAAAMLRLKVEP
jgi:hypothetical protein